MGPKLCSAGWKLFVWPKSQPWPPPLFGLFAWAWWGTSESPLFQTSFTNHKKLTSFSNCRDILLPCLWQLKQIFSSRGWRAGTFRWNMIFSLPADLGLVNKSDTKGNIVFQHGEGRKRWEYCWLTGAVPGFGVMAFWMANIQADSHNHATQRAHTLTQTHTVVITCCQGWETGRQGDMLHTLQQKQHTSRVLITMFYNEWNTNRLPRWPRMLP